MRHTLLPLKERIVLRREYTIRTVIVFCFTLSLAGLIGVVSLFPTVIKISVEKNHIESEVASSVKTAEDSGLKSLQDDISKSQELLKVLKVDDESLKLSEIINEIVGIRGSVKLNSIAVSKTSEKSVAITIQGVAPTRDDLLAFKSRFESVSVGNKVDLPISELAKSSDVRFTVQLTRSLP